MWGLVCLVGIARCCVAVRSLRLSLWSSVGQWVMQARLCVEHRAWLPETVRDVVEISKIVCVQVVVVKWLSDLCDCV